MNNYNNFNEFNSYLLDNNQFNYSNNIFGPYEGYSKGNMFKDIYEQYKDFNPISPTISSEKEEALFNLSQMCFAMHDLNLYLDVHPNDTFSFNQFNEYKKTYDDLLKKYQEKFGPLEITGTKEYMPFDWVNNEFPWEGK